jgi:hypothetical protein
MLTSWSEKAGDVRRLRTREATAGPPTRVTTASVNPATETALKVGDAACRPGPRAPVSPPV